MISYDHHLFLLFKTSDFEQNSWFFGPKSRSSIGGFAYKCREIIIEIIKKIWRFEWKLMFSIKINIKSRRKRASICLFRLQMNENQEGNEHFFKILFQNFRIFDGCYSEIVEFRGRAEGVFYPKVKKESKNSSIEARTSWDKNRDFFWCIFQLVSIITFRNRGVLSPALERLLPEGCSVSVPIFSSIGDDVCGKLEIRYFFLYLLLLYAT